MQAIGNSETAAAMRILNLTSHQLFPVVSGGQSDVLRFLEALSPHHDLYVFGEEGGLNRAQLPQAQMVEGLPRGKQKYASPRAALRFLRAVRSIEPDVIVIDYPWFGALAMIARLLFGVPYIVHEHNAEYVRFRRLGRWWWWMLAGYEAAVCWGARFVFCKTAADKAALTGSLKINAEKIIELPYGIDRDVFRPNPEARRRSVTHTGALAPLTTVGRDLGNPPTARMGHDHAVDGARARSLILAATSSLPYHNVVVGSGGGLRLAGTGTGEPLDGRP